MWLAVIGFAVVLYIPIGTVVGIYLFKKLLEDKWMLDKEKMSGYDEGAGVFMVISNDETKEKSEVNFKNIIAGGDGNKAGKENKEVRKRVTKKKFVMWYLIVRVYK